MTLIVNFISGLVYHSGNTGTHWDVAHSVEQGTQFGGLCVFKPVNTDANLKL